MVSYNPVRFGGHRHSSSRDMFLVVMWFRKTMGWKHTAYHINNFDAGHTLQAAIGKKLKITFASLSKNGGENEKEKKEKEKKGNCKTFCVTLKRNNKSFSPKPLAIPKYFL